MSKEFNLRKTLLALTILLVLMFLPFIRYAMGPKEYIFSGETMGTHYYIQIIEKKLSPEQRKDIKNAIEIQLNVIDDQMSTYNPESEISKFNSMKSREPFAISPEFAEVLAIALEVAKETKGAFDPSVGPLVDLWGFGHEGNVTTAPAKRTIIAVKKNVDYRLIKMSDDGTIRKKRGALQINLNALAKGYSVDKVTKLLSDRGYSNILVDIGGELSALGYNAKNIPWRIAVQMPSPNAGRAMIYSNKLELIDISIATSGDYRNYFRENGKLYSHIIDPRTGFPVDNGLASVTVITKKCVIADALATALTVLNYQDGLDLVNKHTGLEALFIIRTEDGSFKDIKSDGFDKY